MSLWALKCPVCKIEFDSHDSYADTQEMIDYHTERNHKKA